jgi:hypothetical protein
MHYPTAATTASLRNASQPIGACPCVAQHCLDMLYACDPEMVDGHFHETSQLRTLELGRPVFRSVHEYKAVPRARTSPRSLDEPREEQPITPDPSSPS